MKTLIKVPEPQMAVEAFFGITNLKRLMKKAKFEWWVSSDNYNQLSQLQINVFKGRPLSLLIRMQAEHNPDG